jgi:polyribonucleotide nucleotidyltransferase
VFEYYFSGDKSWLQIDHKKGRKLSVNDQGAVIVNSSEVSQILKTQESQVRAMANNPDNAAIYVGVVVGGTF